MSEKKKRKSQPRPPVAPKVEKKRRAGAGRRCIKPGCTKISTGPRFRWCCKNHRDEKLSTILKWMKEYDARRR